MKILQGNRKYIDNCLSVARELKQYFTTTALRAIEKDLHRHLLFIAIDSVDSKKLLGFAAIDCKNQYVAEILWIVVKKEYQNNGIGSSLINYINNDLKAQGIKLLEVKTLSKDIKNSYYEKTRRFYKKLGFVHLETIDHYHGWDPGNPCAIYVKII
jgi:ribosomal protein S18 acetylase RimI-like enzyme